MKTPLDKYEERKTTSMRLAGAHARRLAIINKPFPRLTIFDTHTRTARWAGAGLGFGSRARHAYDENDNRSTWEDRS